MQQNRVHEMCLDTQSINETLKANADKYHNAHNNGEIG